MMPARKHIPLLLLAGVLLAALSGCAGGVLDPQGPVGVAQRTIIYNSMAIMLAIVVPTIVAIVGFAWWFREGNARARYQPDFVYSGQIELVVWSIPTLTIMFLGGVIWIGSHQLDPARPLDPNTPPLEVQVVSLDWKWLFIYPEQGVASVNEVVVPAGRPVRFSLTSSSVMNTFFVPQMGSMIYTMNGMTSQLNLQADAEGQFEGLSGHYSGDGFSDMRFKLRSAPPGGFEAWVQEAKARTDSPVLDRDAYVELAKQSHDVTPFTYRDVARGLFQAVVIQSLPPGPGPAVGDPAPDVSPRS
jgi:cytochrome o ubiquinol oxidase subunit II